MMPICKRKEITHEIAVSGEDMNCLYLELYVKYVVPLNASKFI